MKNKVVVLIVFLYTINMFAQDTLTTVANSETTSFRKKRKPAVVSDRPGYCVSANVTPHKRLIWEQGFTYTKRNNQRGNNSYYSYRFAIEDVLLKYGLFNRAEVILGYNTFVDFDTKIGNTYWVTDGTYTSSQYKLGGKLIAIKEQKYVPQIAFGTIIYKNKNMPINGFVNFILEKNILKKYITITGYTEFSDLSAFVVYKTTFNVHKNFALFSEQSTRLRWKNNVGGIPFTYDVGFFVPLKTFQFDFTYYHYKRKYDINRYISHTFSLGFSKLF